MSKITRAKWTGGVAGRLPALQVESPEFKPQSHQKKKKKSYKTNPNEIPYLLMEGHIAKGVATGVGGMAAMLYNLPPTSCYTSFMTYTCWLLLPVSQCSQCSILALIGRMHFSVSHRKNKTWDPDSGMFDSSIHELFMMPASHSYVCLT
jgi:hypothetical protein